MNKTSLSLSLLFSLFTIGCTTTRLQNSQSTDESRAIPIKSYTTFWYVSADSAFLNPIDTLTIELSRNSVDTLGDSPFSSPGRKLNYLLKERNHVSLQLFSRDAKKCTKPVEDTLDIGSYTFTLNASQLEDGIYFWRRLIGGHSNTKRIMLLK